MTFDEWLKSKQDTITTLFPYTSWLTMEAFLKEIYNTAYEKGYKEGQDDYERSITRL